MRRDVRATGARRKTIETDRSFGYGAPLASLARPAFHSGLAWHDIHFMKDEV